MVKLYNPFRLNIFTSDGKYFIKKFSIIDGYVYLEADAAKSILRFDHDISKVIWFARVTHRHWDKTEFEQYSHALEVLEAYRKYFSFFAKLKRKIEEWKERERYVG